MNHPRRAHVALWICLFFSGGCDAVVNFLNDLPTPRPPADSAARNCFSTTSMSPMERIIKDQLACDCQAIDGRDPKCWGFREYRNKPMPLPPPMGQQAIQPETPLVSQAGGPEIPLYGIVNAASFMNRVLAAGAIARGSMFTIFGSGIGPAAGVGATAFPLASELGGVRIRVFTLDAEVEAIPLFVSTGQINAIMPSDAPLGFVAVEVTFGGQTSNVAPVQVVDAAVGVFTATGTGAGPASVTNFVSQTEQPLNTVANPASPSQLVTLWVTGLGPVAGPDTMRPADIGGVVDLQGRVNLEILVGSRRVTNIFYAGRSAGFSGLDQIVFQVPADAEPGCYTPVHVRANGRPANGVTLALGPEGGACPQVDNPLALPDASRAAVRQAGRVQQGLAGVLGTVDFLRMSGVSREELADPFEDFVIEQGGARFVMNPPAPAGYSIITNLPPLGTCVASSGLDQDGEAGGVTIGLESNVDAGGEVTVTRGDGVERMIDSDGTLLGGGLPGFDPDPLFLEPGRYRIESGGGAQVGPLGMDVDVPAPVMVINRGGLDPLSRAGFEVRWQGGSPGQTVVLVGSSTNGIERAEASFGCTADAAAGFLRVPDYALANLPDSRVPEDGMVMLMGLRRLAPLTATGVDVGSVTFTSIDFKPTRYRP